MHTSKDHSRQYIPIHTNTYQFIPIHITYKYVLGTNTDKYQ